MDEGYLILILTGCLFRFDVGFRNFNKIIGLELSSTKQGTGYQDAITPPKLNWLSYAVYGVTGITIFSAFADYSTKEGFISIGVFAASAIIFGVIMFPPKGQSRLDKFFFKTLFNSMVNRLANYERDKDVNRAAAMRMLVNKFKNKYSKKIIWRHLVGARFKFKNTKKKR